MKLKLLFTLGLLMSTILAKAQNTTPPEFVFNPIAQSVQTHTNFDVVANLVSNGHIDELSQIKYKIYRDNVLIDQVSDFGSIKYSIRSIGQSYHNGNITTGESILSVSLGTREVSALTLGILDSYCVSRGRPVNLNLRFTVPGTYRLVLEIYKCSDTGIDVPLSQGYPTNTNVGCDGQTHRDKYADLCTSPEIWNSQEIQLNVISNPGMPSLDLTGLLPEYEKNQPFNVSAQIHSNGYVDSLCALKYTLFRDGNIVTNLSDLGNMKFSVRESGNTIYEQSILTGSGNVSVDAGSLSVAAFSLGIFDDICTDRNRPVVFSGSFSAPGNYKLVTELMGCKDTRVSLNTTYTSTCDNTVHTDYYAPTCTRKEAIILTESVFKVNPGIPTVDISGLNAAYVVDDEMEITAQIHSNGYIDSLCGLKYRLYRNNVLVDNILTVGNMKFGVREAGNTIYEQSILTGSGEVSVSVGSMTISAFTLGIFDDECTDRNRPVVFTGKFSVPGNYRLVTELTACSDERISLNTTYTSSCDNTVHTDYYASTCTSSEVLISNESLFTVKSRTPIIEVTGVNQEYLINEQVLAIAQVHSKGYVDSLCGLKYELFRNDVAVADIASVGTMKVKVREVGTAYFEQDIVDGSGLMEVSITGITLAAFTLGIFDDECVSRNRPIEFIGSFSQTGDYKLVTSLVACRNTPITLGTSFLSTCDGDTHIDNYSPVCTDVETLFSQETLFSVKPGAGVDNISSSYFNVYPTIFDDKLTIESSNSGAVTIVNSLGQIVLQDHVIEGKQSINLGFLNSGLYFVEFQNKTHKVVKK